MKATQPSDPQDDEAVSSNDGENSEKIAQLMDHIATLEKNFREVMDASYNSEKERSSLLDKITQLESLLKKKEDTLNSMRLSMKLLRSRQPTSDPTAVRDRDVETLQLEIKTLQEERKVESQEWAMRFFDVKQRLEVYENRYGDQIRAENDKIKKLEEQLHLSQQQVNELLIQKSEILSRFYILEEELKQIRSVPQYKQEEAQVSESPDRSQMEIQESLPVQEQQFLKSETPKRTSMGAFISSSSSVKRRRTQTSVPPLWNESNTELEEVTSQLNSTKERLQVVEEELEKKLQELRSEQDIKFQQEETIKQLQSVLSSALSDSTSSKDSLQQQIASLESQISEKDRDLQQSSVQLKEVTTVLKQYQEMLKSSSTQVFFILYSR